MTGQQQPASLTSQLTQQLDLDFALQAAGLGVWELDPVTSKVRWDDRCRSLFGLASDNYLAYEQAMQYIHPQDVDRVDQAVAWAMNPQSDGNYDQTYRTIGADDQLIRWVRFFGRSYFSPTGELYRFAGLAQEVTQQVAAQKRLEESQHEILTLFEEAPVGIATINADEALRFQSANPFYGQLVGRQPEALIDKPLLEALPELVGQGFDDLLRQVITTGVPFTAKEIAVDLVRNDRLETIYVDLVYQPRCTADGAVFGILVVATDVTQQVMSRRQVEASEATLRGLIQAAPAGIGVFVGRDLVIANPNQTFIDIVGKGPAIEGLPLREAMPELISEGQPFLKILDDVYQTGVPFISPASLVKIRQNGMLQDNYYNISYSPLRNAAGQVYAILDIAIDVTAQIKVQQALAQSEQHLQRLRDTVPALIFYLDHQQRYQSYNQTFRHWFEVDETEVIGKTVREFVGELAYQALQPHLAIAYAGVQEHFELLSPARLGKARWLSITYTPHLTATGEVVGLIVHAADITASKQSQAVLQQQQTALQNAIELAQLGTFSVDVKTNLLTVSPLVADWFGFAGLSADAEAFIGGVGESERDYVRTCLYNTLRADSDGRYDVEHSVIHAQTGQQIIIHALGQLYRDADGQPARIEGTAHDITAQRALQQVLEEQVQQRTQELSQANKDLKRSNDNLQTFAYVASHDLQEPLRKVQSFSTLLAQYLGDRLDATSRDYLERINKAGARMSTLIKDLLSYSRIATHQQTFGPIALGAVLAGVLETLSLEIDESQALIEVDALPIVNGDGSQLDQLFQNLLSNALKFRRPHQAPRIHLQATRIGADELPPGARPSQSAPTYHRIEVSDNGIGFDEKYVDRIFQVFQRLHSKNQYAGTGIGLAICEKVVINHGGGLTASSTPGQGATFSVYLPA